MTNATVEAARTAKDAIREGVWRTLTAEKVGRFPFPLAGRIPNFAGSEACARHLADVPEWQAASTLKGNPDAPQRAVRLAALEAGKTVFMAVPRLTKEKCFLKLDPKRLQGRFKEAASLKGATRLGEPAAPGDVPPIDLVVVGSVAVNAWGARVGKGGGYSDLEFALARQLGLVTEDTPVLTTVHPLQVVDEKIPMTPHDVPVDVVVTPEGAAPTARVHAKPTGILRDHLTDAQVQAMPPVARALGARRP